MTYFINTHEAIIAKGVAPHRFCSLFERRVDAVEDLAVLLDEGTRNTYVHTLRVADNRMEALYYARVIDLAEEAQSMADSWKADRKAEGSEKGHYESQTL